MDRYDADEAPTPELWLALTEEERKALVLRHHHGRVERTLHPPGYPRDFHATLHVLVENEVASKEPPITAQTLDRLCAEGLRRHAAVHALGGSRTPPLNGLVDLAWMSRDTDRVRSGLALAREWGVPGTFAAALRTVECELGAEAMGDEQLDMVAGVRPKVREGLAGRALSRPERTFRHDIVAGLLSLRGTRDRVRYIRGLATARRTRP